MKKVLLTILAAIAVVGMVSCNKDDNNKGGKKGKTTTEVNIKIDGDLADWADVPVGAEVSEDTDEARAALLTLKAGADSKNLYIYFEAQLEEDQASAPIDIFINADGDTSTGFSSWLWSEVGWEFLLESETGCLADANTVRDMDDMSIYKAKTWQDAAGEQLDGWGTGAEMEQLELSGFCTSAGKVVNGIAFVEIAIERGAINARTKGSLGLGVEFHSATWGDIGMLPIGTTTGEVGVMEVALP